MAARERLICASADLAESGRGWRFDVGSGGGTAVPAFAVRHQGVVRGYLNRCGHIPVELDWQPGEFFDASGLYLICATHGALYAPESGRCLAGRCNGKGLDRLEMVEREGQVFLIERDERRGGTD